MEQIENDFSCEIEPTIGCFNIISTQYRRCHNPLSQYSETLSTLHFEAHDGLFEGKQGMDSAVDSSC